MLLMHFNFIVATHYKSLQDIFYFFLVLSYFLSGQAGGGLFGRDHLLQNNNITTG